MDPMRTKQLEKGIEQLTDEGVAQLFVMQPGNRKVIGAVGELQFEVIIFRLEHEYGAKCRLRTLTYSRSRWITSTDHKKLDEFVKRKQQHIGIDKEGLPVFLSDNDFMIDMTKRDYPDIEFHTTSEFK